MYEKILVPLDGSALAEQAFPCTARLGEAFSSEVTLIYICEHDGTEYGNACHQYLTGMVEAFRKITGADASLKISTTFFFGKAASEILRYAEESGTNLIVMTSHGHSGIVPWSMGGTVNKILQRVGIPLLVVRAQEQSDTAAAPDLFRKIVVSLDGSSTSEAVLPYIAEVARKMDSELYLFHVAESGRQVHTLGGIDYVPFKDQDMAEQKMKARKYLEGLASHLTGVSKINYEVSSGDAAREIIKFADEKECGLIAISSHGHSAIAAWAFGSITEKVLHASKKSIFFFPSPGIRQK